MHQHRSSISFNTVFTDQLIKLRFHRYWKVFWALLDPKVVKRCETFHCFNQYLVIKDMSGKMAHKELGIDVQTSFSLMNYHFILILTWQRGFCEFFVSCSCKKTCGKGECCWLLLELREQEKCMENATKVAVLHRDWISRCHQQWIHFHRSRDLIRSKRASYQFWIK